MSKTKVNWLILHDGRALCARCGRSHPLLPLSIPAMNKVMAGYEEEHRHCKPGPVTYPVPVVIDPRGSVERRADAWLNKSEDTGISSKTIRRFMLGVPASSILAEPLDASPPSDPSDFGRCRRLLALIPEWRPRIAEMAALPRWAPLVAVWDELDALFNEEVPDGRTGNAPRLFARMQELSHPKAPKDKGIPCTGGLLMVDR